MSYKVKIDVFEGPFDLLVYLIESAKMSIYEIAIAEITDQYLEYIEELKSVDMDNAAEFLVLAATLIEMKSKMLLPRSDSDTLEGDQEDPRKNLMQKLIEYKRFKEIAEKMGQMEDLGLRRWYKPQEDLAEYVSDEDHSVIVIDPKQFIEIFRVFLEKRRKIDEIHRTYDLKTPRNRKTTVRERINFISTFLKSTNQVRFLEIAEECENKYDVVVTFSAMLEMMRNRQILVKQKARFGEIIIEKGDAPEDSAAADLMDEDGDALLIDEDEAALDEGEAELFDEDEGMKVEG